MASGTDALVEKYVQLRDAKKALQEQTKAKVERIDAVMDKIEAALLNKLNAEGGESIRTAAGTAFKDTKTFSNVKDWDAFLKWVVEQKVFQFLKHDVVKTAVQEYREANDNRLPPGVDWQEEIVIKVRRPS